MEGYIKVLHTKVGQFCAKPLPRMGTPLQALFGHLRTGSLFLFVLLLSSCWSQPEEESDFRIIPGEFIFYVDDSVDFESLKGFSSAEKVERLDSKGTWIKVSGMDSPSQLTLWSKRDGVTFISPNFSFRPIRDLVDHESHPSPQIPREGGPTLPGERFPNDPHMTDSWGLYNQKNKGADIGAPQAWAMQTESRKDLVIAVIDSGVDYHHEDLSENIWVNPNEIPDNGVDDDQNGYIDDVYGINSFSKTGDPMDYNGHGTYCAGIIGARGDNSVGSTGVLWKTQIMPINASNQSGDFSFESFVRAISYAIEMKASIINASWGYYRTPKNSDGIEAIGKILKKVKDQGILFVTVAGNQDKDIDQVELYPARYPYDNILVVTSTTQKDELNTNHNFGKKTVHLAAPGTFIFGTDINNHYKISSGTSAAAPFATGAAAHIWTRFPNLTYLEVKNQIIHTVKKLDSLETTTISGGRLDLNAALTP